MYSMARYWLHSLQLDINKPENYTADVYARNTAMRIVRDRVRHGFTTSDLELYLWHVAEEQNESRYLGCATYFRAAKTLEWIPAPRGWTGAETGNMAIDAMINHPNRSKRAHVRDRAHYVDMLERNKGASVGHTLAAKMVIAGLIFRNVKLPADTVNEAERVEARRLREQYGETMTVDEVLAEMGEPN